MGKSGQRVEIAMSVVGTPAFFVKALVALVLAWCSTAFAGTAQNPLVERIEDVGGAPAAGSPWISDIAFRITYDVSASPATFYSVGDKYEYKIIDPARSTLATLTSTAEDGGGGIGCFASPNGPFCSVGKGYLTFQWVNPTVGTWKVETRFNGALVNTASFPVLPYTIAAQSGSGQTIQPNSITNPLSVAILTPLGTVPTKSNSSSTWTITTRPRNGDAGLSPVERTTTRESTRLSAGRVTGVYTVAMSHPWAPGKQATFGVTVAGMDPLAAANPEKMLGDIDSGGCSAATAGRTRNPIQLANGNKFRVVEDYAANGTNAVSLTRYQNSLDTRSGAMGVNWRHSFERALKLTSTRSKAGTTTTAKVERPDGAIYTFTRLNAGPWQGDADVLATLGTTVSGFVYTCDSDQQEHYDSTGRLVKLTLRGGTFPQTLTYNALGLLDRVTDSGGRSLRFAYNAVGKAVSVTDPANRAISYTYFGSSDNLDSVTYQDGAVLERAAGPINWQHRGALPPQGFFGDRPDDFWPAVYTQDGGSGRVTRVEGPEENIDIYYRDNGVREVFDRQTNTSKTYSFAVVQGKARRTASTEVNCQACPVWSSSTAYFTSGNVSEWTDVMGSKTTVTRDARQLEISRVEGVGTALQRSTTTTWHPTYRLPVSVNRPGQRTDYSYDAAGSLTMKSLYDLVGGKVRTWTYGYDAASRLISVDGPRTDVSDVTLLTYDAAGNVASIANALGHTTSFTSHDSHGRVLSSTDPNGLVTTYAYDLRGKPTNIARGARVTSYTYDIGGRLRRAAAPDGSWTEYDYEETTYGGSLMIGFLSKGRLIRTRTSGGETTAYTLDSTGRPGAITTVGFGGTQARSYLRDREGRILTEYDGSGQLVANYRYDGQGNLTAVVYPSGRTASTTFDIFGRKLSSAEPDGGTTTFSYDARDNLMGVVDPIGAIWSHAFDGHDNLVAEQSPTSGRSTFAFDAAGNQVARAWANGRSLSSAYDALNRTVAETDGSGGQVTYGYDASTNAKGRLVQMLDLGGSTTYAYTPHGEVVSKVRVTGARSFSTGFGYDVAGRLVSMVYPSGKVVGYGYDAGGRVGSMTINGASLLQSVVWHPNAMPTSWLQGNGRAVARSYDGTGRLLTQTFENGSRSMGYDLDGRLGAVAALGRSTSYGYDAASRLTSEADGSRSLTYAYDANGNRRSRVASGWGSIDGTTNYGYASNLLQSLSGSQAGSLGYDASGNLIADGTASLGYDARNRLSQAPGAAYNYDGDGLRVLKNSTVQGARYFAHGLGRELLGEYDASQAIYETVYLGALPVAVLKGDQTYWIDADQIQTPRSIRNAGDQVVWRWDSEAFGSTPALENPSGLGTFEYNQRFPGQVYDRETGLHQNDQRDYLPAFGRYIQSDPSGLAGGINTYTYVDGNPISYIDPDGLTKRQGGASLRPMYPPIGPAAIPSTQRHHPGPMFMGYPRHQELTPLVRLVHESLHRDLNNFLRTQTNEFGQHMRPQSNNSGRDIQRNFSRDQRFEALREFYNRYGEHYPQAARDFFRQFPDQSFCGL